MQFVVDTSNNPIDADECERIVSADETIDILPARSVSNCHDLQSVAPTTNACSRKLFVIFTCVKFVYVLSIRRWLTSYMTEFVTGIQTSTPQKADYITSVSIFSMRSGAYSIISIIF